MGGSCIMAVSAGRVLMLPKGNYDATTTYEFLDAVYYSGSTYICKQQTTGHAPTDTTYWQLMAQGTQSAQIAGNYYGTCDTASATANKVVTVPASENFVLQIGDIVGVRFTNTNTANNPTLNVNNSGAKPIYYNDDAVHTNYLWAGGEADRDTVFMYDGTNWVWIAHDVDLNTDALADLTDTAISSPADGDGIVYDDQTGKWKNSNNIATKTSVNEIHTAHDTVLSATLTAGQTTLTFTNNAIVSNSMCELLLVGGVIIAPTQITDDSANHSVTFTFDAQSTDISFKLRVINIV